MLYFVQMTPESQGPGKLQHEKVRTYDDRKTSEALGTLRPLVFETLGEDRGGVGTQGYQVLLEEKVNQKIPGESRDRSYYSACCTLRSQGKSLKDIALALLSDPRVVTGLNLGNKTETALKADKGTLMDALSEVYPGAKPQRLKKKKVTDW